MELSILLISVLSLLLRDCAVKAAGLIGSGISDHDTGYEPAEIPQYTFFLNANSSAKTNGSISTITFCFFQPRNLTQNFYQATVGIYRQKDGGITYSLLNSFILTKTLISLTNNSNSNTSDPLCEKISIQSMEVQEGDAFGVCQNVASPSLFNHSCIKAGDMNLVAKGGGSLMQLVGSVCSSLGSVPETVLSESLQSQENSILLLSASITSVTDSSECHQVKITKAGIATSTIALGLVSGLIFTALILICVTRCLRKKPQAVVVHYDEKESFSQVNYHKRERPRRLNISGNRELVNTTSPQYDYARTSPLIGSSNDLLDDLQDTSSVYNEVEHHYQCPDSETSVDTEDLDPSSPRFKLKKIDATSPKYDDPVAMQRNICYGSS